MWAVVVSTSNPAHQERNNVVEGELNLYVYMVVLVSLCDSSVCGHDEDGCKITL